MCGRYSFEYKPSFAGRFRVQAAPEGLRSRYNVAPGMTMPVVLSQSPNHVELMKWGLVPAWSKEPKVAYSTINARAENLQQSATYRRPFKSQRCLVPVSGFFEWKKTSDGKQPYCIRVRKEEYFALAGLYDIWRGADGTEIKTYTIVTTTPNELMAPIHNRMPVVLNPEYEDIWLDAETSADELLGLLTPYPADQMEANPVSTRVNSPRNDDPGIIEAI